MILSLIFVCCAFALPWATATYDEGDFYMAYKWYGGSYKYTYDYETEFSTGTMSASTSGSDSEKFPDGALYGPASTISIASMAVLMIMYLALSIVIFMNKSEEKVGSGVMRVFSVLLLVGSFVLLVGVIIWILEFNDQFDDMSTYEVSSCASGCALGMTAAVVSFLYGIVLAGATCCVKESGYDNSAPAGSTAVPGGIQVN